MDQVGLNRRFANRFPHEFSGGQRQRIGIARALALNPKFIVCDEPIAALDVSIQAQVVNLLEDLQDRLGLTYLFISHDLSHGAPHRRPRGRDVPWPHRRTVARATPSMTARCTPMPRRCCPPSTNPTPALARRERIILQGDVPSPANPPKGCNFCTRCPRVMDICRTVKPDLSEVEPGRLVACHLYPANRGHRINRRSRGQRAQPTRRNKMRFKTALLGAAASVALAQGAYADRGTDGDLKLTFPQAVSIMNPYLSNGTKDVYGSSMMLEPSGWHRRSGQPDPETGRRNPDRRKRRHLG